MPKKEVKKLPLNEESEKQIQVNLSETKDELYDYLKTMVQNEVKLEASKEVKKIIRNKNVIIIKRDIIILILLVCCFFLGYNLYKISNIRIDITKEDKTSTTKEVKEKTSDGLSEKISKYGKYLDDIYVCEDSEYLNDYYKGNLTDELKLYLSLNHLDDDSIVNEDSMTYINSDSLKESFSDIIDGEVNMKSFKWGDKNFKYLSSKELFIHGGEFKKNKCNIKREIIDIKDDDNLIITTLEGNVKDGKIYSTDGKEIGEYKDNLTDYKSSLTSVSYVFIKNDNGYKLSKIEA